MAQPFRLGPAAGGRGAGGRGAGFYSLVGGYVALALLVVLAMELMSGPFAVLGALAAGVSLSVWMDSSLAEVHTMTMALSVATYFALRFGHSARAPTCCG